MFYNLGGHGSLNSCYVLLFHFGEVDFLSRNCTVWDVPISTTRLYANITKLRANRFTLHLCHFSSTIVKGKWVHFASLPFYFLLSFSMGSQLLKNSLLGSKCFPLCYTESPVSRTGKTVWTARMRRMICLSCS